MTKVTKLVEEEEEENKLPIRFLYLLNYHGEILEPIELKPADYENIKLICKNYLRYDENDLDLIFAWDSNPNNGVLYLGKFNDGIV